MRDHLVRVVRRDVRREKLALARFRHGHAHGLDHLRDALVHLAECLVALGLVVLDEVAALPEAIAGLAERLRLQAELGFDDGADHQATAVRAAAQDATCRSRSTMARRTGAGTAAGS